MEGRIAGSELVVSPLSGSNLRVGWPEQTCPTCDTVHHGGAVVVYHEGNEIFRGCWSCWGILTREFPQYLAWREQQGVVGGN